jgi:SAM-dependent methyltransferase
LRIPGVGNYCFGGIAGRSTLSATARAVTVERFGQSGCSAARCTQRPYFVRLPAMANIEPHRAPSPAASLAAPLLAEPPEGWDPGAAYERWMGRWSRKVAFEFLRWLGVPAGAAWADIGCGTGALTEGILRWVAPRAVIAIDRSEAYVAEARARIRDPRAQLYVGDGADTGLRENTFDATVSGLVLDSLPDAEVLLEEMKRITMPSGVVAAYVWDYAGGMEMVRHFWDVAAELNPRDARLDQAERFPLCRPEALRDLFWRTGLADVSVRAIEVPTVFISFDDYWTPYLGGQGSAPAYLASLPADARTRIRELLRARLEAYGCPIAMRARAWAVRGTNPLPEIP